jgi:hypothetical protein
MDATILFIYQILLLSKFKEKESLYEYHIFVPYLLVYQIKYQPGKSLSIYNKKKLPKFLFI